VTHRDELDDEVARAIESRTLAENVAIIEANQLTAMPVQTIADIEAHPHWQARRLTLDVANGSGGVRMHNVVPRLSESPGEIRWPGGELGQDNHAVYGALGISCDEQQRLRASGVI
jgi:crotonobetainyl-CoA:carnitine CoA-transferase CaiB-like acyl-CoA transferase